MFRLGMEQELWAEQKVHRDWQGNGAPSWMLRNTSGAGGSVFNLQIEMQIELWVGAGDKTP